ncbi:MAG: TonB family protein [Steroidobacteraceae bacterium]
MKLPRLCRNPIWISLIQKLRPETRPAAANPRKPIYSAESKRLSEQGRSMLNVTVQLDGRTPEVSLLQSTGYSRLDQACQRAFVFVVTSFIGRH